MEAKLLAGPSALIPFSTKCWTTSKLLPSSFPQECCWRRNSCWTAPLHVVSSTTQKQGGGIASVQAVATPIDVAKRERIDESESYTLEGIRSSLIRQEDSIIFSLMERAQFCHNTLTYSPDAFSFDGLQGSLAEYMIRETEKLHARGDTRALMSILFSRWICLIPCCLLCNILRYSTLQQSLSMLMSKFGKCTSRIFFQDW